MTKVLIVEEFATMRRVIRNLLAINGIDDTEEVSGGLAALIKLRASHFDLVIASWKMEPMTGLDLVKEMRG